MSEAVSEPLPPDLERIAVLRALELGDLLCSVPALRALRRAYPRAEITLVGLDWASAYVRRFATYLDEFVELPGFPGLPERPFDPRRFSAFLRAAHERRFDLVLQMHGSGSFVNPLAVMLGGRLTAGFYLPGEYCPDPRYFVPYPEGEHEIWRQLRLVEALGLPSAGDELEFPVLDGDRAELAALVETRGLQPRGYVCLHPGARYPSRRWPLERFAAVGRALAAAGLELVITGSRDELQLADELSRRLNVRHRVLTGKTSLGGVAALLADARLLVSNDTGVSHIAAGVGTPSVIVVTGSDPKRWRPLDEQRHRVVRHQVECQPCGYRICPIDHRCATGVTVDMVLQQCRELLDSDRQKVVERVARGVSSDPLPEELAGSCVDSAS